MDEIAILGVYIENDIHHLIQAFDKACLSKQKKKLPCGMTLLYFFNS